ncbi:MAG: hypothetical protein JXR70_17520 [Spirochaetales bacterium]|nr:hypothetical protein [Spirochaetales bacterium]
MKRFFLLIVIFWSGAYAFAQSSRIPQNSNNYIQNATSIDIGDPDQVNVIFFEVPDSLSEPIYFAINDPYNHANFPDSIGNGGSSTTFSLFGGSGCYSDIHSRDNFYTPVEKSANYHRLGTLLDTQVYDNTPNAGWFYFCGVSPNQGEHIGNKYYFKVVVEISGGSDYKNAYQLDISTDNTQGNVPDPVPGANAFSYSWCITVLDNASNTWNLFPFVPESATGQIIFSNFEFDSYETIRAFNANEEDLGLLPSSGGGSTFPSDVVSAAFPLSGMVNDSWQLLITPTDDEGTNDFINTSEIFAENDGSGELLRIYSFDYTPPADQKVVVTSNDGIAITGGSERLMVQISDIDGNPAPFVKNVWINLSSVNARIIDDNNHFTTWPAQAGLITTNSEGLGWVEISCSLDENVSVDAYTNGVILPGNNPAEWNNSGMANEGDSVIFYPDILPSISSSENLAFVEKAAQVLKNISIRDLGTANITAASDLRIVIPSSLDVNFEPEAIVNIILDGTGNGLLDDGTGGSTSSFSGTLNYENNNKTAVIGIYQDFDVNRTITLSGLCFQENSANPSNGHLELNTGAPSNSIDDKLITIHRNNSIYTWIGGNGANWSEANNWSPSGPPTPGSSVIITNSGNPYPLLNQNIILGNLSIGSGASLSSNAPSLAIEISGTLNNEGVLELRGDEASFSATMDIDSGKVVYCHSSGNFSGLAAGNSYYDLEFDCPGITATLNHELTVHHDLNITNGTLDVSSANYSISIANDFNISGGTFAEQQGLVIFTGTTNLPAETFYHLEIDSSGIITAAAPLDINGNFNISNGTFNGNSQFINIAGNFINEAVFSANDSTLIFDGTLDQRLNPGNSSIHHLQKINNSRLSLENNPLTLNGILSISSDSRVDMANMDFTVNILDNQGVLSFEGTQNTQNITAMDSDSGTIVYTGASRNVNILWPEFYSLEIDDHSQDRIFTLNQAIIVHGNLTITSGTLNAGNAANSISVSGNWTNSGSFNASNAPVLFSHNSMSTVTIDTGGTGDNKDFDAIEFNDAGAGATFQLINNHLDVNGDITISSGTLAANNLDITIGGDWVNRSHFDAGTGTVIFSSNNPQMINSGGGIFFNLTTTGGNHLYAQDSEIVVNGTLTIDESCTITLDDLDFLIARLINSGRLELGGQQTTQVITLPDLDSGTIRYTRSGGIIRLSDFYNLQIDTNGIISTNNALTINNNLQIMNGTFDGNSQSLTISGDFINSAVFTANNTSLVFNGTTSQSLNPGNSSLYNISKIGSDVLNLDDHGLTLTGILFIDQGCTMNLSAYNFSISTLENLGTLELEGTQNTQQITNMDFDSGRVLYTGASGNASIGLIDFYSLEINDNSTGRNFSLRHAIMVNNDLTITSGTLDAADPVNTITVGANWSNTGGFISRNANLVFNHNTPSIVTIDTGGTGDLNDFDNILFNDNGAGASFQLVNNHLDVNNNLTISSGTLSVNGFNITLGGDWTNTGSFSSDSGTVLFSGNQDQRINTGGSSFYNLSKTGNTRLSLINSDLYVTGSLTLTDNNGIFDLANENFTIEAVFNSGVIELDGLQSVQHINVMDTDSGTIRYTSDGAIMSISSFWNLQIQTSGLITAPDTITVNNDFQIVAGSFNGNQQIINIGGDFINSGIFIANNSTLAFNGTTDQYLDPGSSSFYNLSKSGGALLRLRNNPLTITGTLIILSQNSLLLSNLGFSINHLDNQGVLSLVGTQNIQSITTMNPNSGTIVYLNGNAPGTVAIREFWDLIINGPSQNYTLASDITVNNNLRILDGTLNAARHTIYLRRNFDSSSATAIFEPEYGSIVLRDASIPTRISGNNSFYNLICTTPDVKNIYFEAQRTTRFVSGGTFTMIGQPGNFINLRSTIDEAGQHWNLDMTPGSNLDFRYVNVYRSDASSNPIIVPGDVVPHNCRNWLNQMPISTSSTLDLDNDGRIDAIDASVLGGVAINDNFSDLQIEISGYEILYPFNTGQIPFDSVFRIPLKEKAYLDTSATPLWSIVSNTLLRDSATETQVVNSHNHPTGVLPIDNVAPKIGYTLAVAEKNQVFIHFSEEVNTGGFSLTSADFTFSQANPVRVDPITFSTSGNREVLLSFMNSISVQDIYNGNLLTLNTAIEDTAGLNLVENTHRVSDLGLGILNNGLIEPVWAQDETNTISEIEGMGLATDFTGKGWLRDQDIMLQAYVNIDINGSGLNARLVYDVNVSSSWMANNLWLSDYDESSYNGLVPWPNPSSRSLLSIADPVNPQLKNFQLSKDDPEIKNNSHLKFLFQFPDQQLYCARIDNPDDINWYRQAEPWNLDIHDIISQSGNVSVLNNVINPDAGETVKLHYLLDRSGMVIIEVFDLKGDIIDIIERGRKNCGDYSSAWDGKNRGGRSVGRGMYFIKIMGPGIEEIRKVLVVK